MDFPPTGARLPSRGNAFSRAAGRAVLRLIGWRFEGSFPDLPKFVLAAAPHTSNWDFVIGMAALFAAGLRVSWMGKHTLFRAPHGFLMRWMGGLPVDRRSAHGIVRQTMDAFRDTERLVIAMTPEGTRSPVDRWKTGFYHIATKAGVPIVFGFVDYRRRRVGIKGMIEPGGDIEADFEKIREIYADVNARHPENFGTPTTGSPRPR